MTEQIHHVTDDIQPIVNDVIHYGVVASGVSGGVVDWPGVTMPWPKSMLWYQPSACTRSATWFGFTRDETLASENG